ncbi:hypothetical protein [Psychroserpens damuponensis]|uniref:hypothetical protein n=1 Tax=Psychroserpens damuponensis TaxID=943936 RepID=UPI00058C3D4E|nr:hypothetical protein [Psychroserpens damuponensis]
MGIFGSFGKKEKKVDDNYIESILNHSKDEPLGVSDQHVIYAGYNELGGYYYFQTYIIGPLKLKTKTGATLMIEGNNYTYDLKSDMEEIESDQINDVIKGYVTRIDFEIEKKAVESIKRSTVKQLVLTIKKHKIVFNKI